LPTSVASQPPAIQTLNSDAIATSYKQVKTLPETAHLVMHLSQDSKKTTALPHKSPFQRTPHPKLAPLVEIIHKALQELKKCPQQSVTKTILLQSTDITKTMFAELTFKLENSPTGKRHILCTISFQGLTPTENLESKAIITKALNFKNNPPRQHAFLYFGAGATTMVGLGWLLFSRQKETKPLAGSTSSTEDSFKTPHAIKLESSAPDASSETIDVPSGAGTAKGNAQPRRLFFSETPDSPNPTISNPTVPSPQRGRSVSEGGQPRRRSFSEARQAAEGSAERSPDELFDALRNIFYSIIATNLTAYSAETISLDNAFIAISLELDAASRENKAAVIAKAKNLIRDLAMLYKITDEDGSINRTLSDLNGKKLTEKNM